mmetsp:Transcript_35867/g.85035  ORF Transcript_35867/g.85035 Transcript_35867/m.85035 type:complete len:398 (+) Transcript_35867:637-1830(+)
MPPRRWVEVEGVGLERHSCHGSRDGLPGAALHQEAEAVRHPREVDANHLLRGSRRCPRLLGRKVADLGLAGLRVPPRGEADAPPQHSPDLHWPLGQADALAQEELGRPLQLRLADLSLVDALGALGVLCRDAEGHLREEAHWHERAVNVQLRPDDEGGLRLRDEGLSLHKHPGRQLVALLPLVEGEHPGEAAAPAPEHGLLPRGGALREGDQDDPRPLALLVNLVVQPHLAALHHGAVLPEEEEGVARGRGLLHGGDVADPHEGAAGKPGLDELHDKDAAAPADLRDRDVDPLQDVGGRLAQRNGELVSGAEPVEGDFGVGLSAEAPAVVPGVQLVDLGGDRGAAVLDEGPEDDFAAGKELALGFRSEAELGAAPQLLGVPASGLERLLPLPLVLAA